MNGTLASMRKRVLCAIVAHGVYVREENGKLVPLCPDWVAPLVGSMSKSACRYTLLGVNGRKDHGVILSRRMITALQRFAGRKVEVEHLAGLMH